MGSRLSNGHRCPVGDCRERVRDDQLMCRRHWWAVPRDLQRELYRAWRRGAGAGSNEHQAAMADCIAAVEGR